MHYTNPVTWIIMLSVHLYLKERCEIIGQMQAIIT